MHYAVTGNTAAEIIYNRADSKKEHMGLTNWSDAPNGKIIKSDVIIAKNYLSEEEFFDSCYTQINCDFVYNLNNDIEIEKQKKLRRKK